MGLPIDADLRRRLLLPPLLPRQGAEARRSGTWERNAGRGRLGGGRKEDDLHGGVARLGKEQNVRRGSKRNLEACLLTVKEKISVRVSVSKKLHFIITTE